MVQSELLQVRRVVQVLAQPEEVVADKTLVQGQASHLLKLEYGRMLKTHKERQLKEKIIHTDNQFLIFQFKGSS